MSDSANLPRRARKRPSSEALVQAGAPSAGLNNARISVLLVLSAVLLLAAWQAPEEQLRVPLAAVGLSIFAAIVIVWLAALRETRAQKSHLAVIAAFIEHDAAPGFLTDTDGAVRHGNAAAQAMYPLALGKPLSGIFRAVFARPEHVMQALHKKAQAEGSACEDVVTRRGHMRLTVHRIGSEGFLWRFEDVMPNPAASHGSDAIALPVLMANAKGTVLFMNEAMRRFLGRRLRSLAELFEPGRPQASGRCRIDSADGPVWVEVLRLDGAGGRQEVYFLPPGTPAGPKSGVGHRVDVEALPVAALLLEDGGRVAHMNQRARLLLPSGGREKPVLADLLSGVVRPLEDWISLAAAGGGPQKAELLKITHASEERFVHATIVPKPEDGSGLRLVVLSDATELKTLEAQFVQSQKMQAIGQLAGGVAHDFNNLLTAISGHCDLLLLKHAKDDPDYADLEQIAQNANRAASLVGQLLAFSRKQKMRLEQVDLRQCLSDLTHLLNRLVGEKVSLSFNHDPDVGPVKADVRQIEQVMMNLVVNARDAMPEGGTIAIETTSRTIRAPLRKGRVEIPPGNYSIIRVIDEGSGIPAEDLDKVFEPFFTSKATGEGTGLGLSTVYGIVKQSGGFVFAESVRGQGACFSIYLPSVEAVQEAAPAPQGQARGRAASPVEQGVVLLVEDEEPVRAFASRALRLRGYTVLEAEDAEAAKRILEDEGLQVDVFVSDVIMPGQNGPGWVREALKQRPGVKVVFVSGYAESELCEENGEIPNAVFLPKPFSLNDLTAIVHEQLH